MTRNNTYGRWLQIASISLAVATVGLGTAVTAHATKPYNGEQGEGAFASCYQEAISHAPHNPPTQADADDATFDCCVITGGTWSSNDYHHGGFCMYPPADSGSGRAPLPGSVVVAHPGSDSMRQLS